MRGISGWPSASQVFARTGKPIRYALILIPLVAAFGLAFIITQPSPPTFRQDGRISVCVAPMQGGSPSEAFCPSERPAIGQEINFQEAKLFGRTFSAYADHNGVFVVELPAGRYTVSVEGCKDYPVRKSYPLELTVSSTGWPGWNPPALYWVVDDARRCWSVPPAGL